MTKSRSPFNFGNQNRGGWTHVFIKSSFLIVKLSILLPCSCRRCLLMVLTSSATLTGDVGTRIRIVMTLAPPQTTRTRTPQSCTPTCPSLTRCANYFYLCTFSGPSQYKGNLGLAKEYQRLVFGTIGILPRF
jgi:hypothetical protein